MLQSVIFDRNYWDIDSSYDWLKYHHIYPMKGPHLTNKFVHWRIQSPKKFSRMRTFRIKDHIEFILGFN